MKTFCPECGQNVAVDEDGCCIMCGATATGQAVDKLNGWIKTKDRLPEPFKYVVAWRGSSFIKAFYTGWGYWTTDDGRDIKHPEYWMAIDPPEGKRNENKM